jgi:FkbM family methyltransferase
MTPNPWRPNASSSPQRLAEVGRAELLRWSDFLFSRLLRSPSSTVKYLRLRGRFAGDALLPELAGVGLCGRPLYRVVDPSVTRTHYFNSLSVGGFYRKGLKLRASQLAHSYSLDLVSFRDHDTIVDCGANVGDLYLGIILQSGNLQIQYVAIEPGLDEFACLVNNIQDSDATVVQMALGAEDGTGKLFYEPQGANSSLCEPPNFLTTYEVQVRRLDSLLASLNEFSDDAEHRVRLLKIEAEGTEPEVVAGIGEYASRIDYIAADLGPERGQEQVSTVAPVTQMLYEMGFRMISARGHRYLFVGRDLEA